MSILASMGMHFRFSTNNAAFITLSSCHNRQPNAIFIWTTMHWYSRYILRKSIFDWKSTCVTYGAYISSFNTSRSKNLCNDLFIRNINWPWYMFKNASLKKLIWSVIHHLRRHSWNMETKYIIYLFDTLGLLTTMPNEYQLHTSVNSIDDIKGFIL